MYKGNRAILPMMGWEREEGSLQVLGGLYLPEFGVFQEHGPPSALDAIKAVAPVRWTGEVLEEVLQIVNLNGKYARENKFVSFCVLGGKGEYLGCSGGGALPHGSLIA